MLEVCFILLIRNMLREWNFSEKSKSVIIDLLLNSFSRNHIRDGSLFKRLRDKESHSIVDIEHGFEVLILIIDKLLG